VHQYDVRYVLTRWLDNTGMHVKQIQEHETI